QLNRWPCGGRQSGKYCQNQIQVRQDNEKPEIRTESRAARSRGLTVAHLRLWPERRRWASIHWGAARPWPPIRSNATGDARRRTNRARAGCLGEDWTRNATGRDGPMSVCRIGKNQTQWTSLKTFAPRF